MSGWALALWCAVPAAAQQPSTAPVIGAIAVERINVFDPDVPGEDWNLFQWANKIHLKTRERVVRREMLLRSGDRWNPLKAVEIERNLRGLGFLRHASVTPGPTREGKLDLHVRTQDSWTLQPQISIGTEGGDSFFIAGISEGNLLGLGKEASLFHSEVGPTVRNEARYRDPRVFGTWNRFIGHFADTSRGSETGLRLNRRFYSLETRAAYDAVWAKVNQEEVLYVLAEEDSKFDHDFRTAKGLAGVRLGSSHGLIQRASLGIHYEKSRFFNTADTRAGTLPANRTLLGPVLGYSWIQPRYARETNINAMGRTEDFNLGNELALEGGPMLESWGSDRDRWVFSAVDRQGLSLGKRGLLLGGVGVRGRMAHRVLENAMFFAALNAIWKTGWIYKQTLIAHLEYNTTKNLDREKQLVLGGQTGLRGYKNNSFTGGRSLLLNLENRLFWDRELLHLMYMGGVLFFDTGLVTPTRDSLRLDNLKSDIGFGLRFSPSRSTTGRVARIDIAYRINDGPGKGRWVIAVRGGQAFSLFNSSNRRALRSPDDVVVEGRAADRLLRR